MAAGPEALSGSSCPSYHVWWGRRSPKIKKNDERQNSAVAPWAPNCRVGQGGCQPTGRWWRGPPSPPPPPPAPTIPPERDPGGRLPHQERAAPPSLNYSAAVIRLTYLPCPIAPTLSFQSTHHNNAYQITMDASTDKRLTHKSTQNLMS